jgi:hypothetical protein
MVDLTTPEMNGEKYKFLIEGLPLLYCMVMNEHGISVSICYSSIWIFKENIIFAFTT